MWCVIQQTWYRRNLFLLYSVGTALIVIICYHAFLCDSKSHQPGGGAITLPKSEQGLQVYITRWEQGCSPTEHRGICRWQINPKPYFCDSDTMGRTQGF